MTDVSSSVVMTLPGDTKLPILTRRNPVRPLNGARITVSSSRACAAAARASSAFSVASTTSKSATGSICRDRRSRLRSYWLRLRASAAWASASAAPALRVVHLDEHGAALDFLALLEADRRDGVRDFRRDVDGLVGERRAHGLDLDAHELDARRLCNDGYRRTRRGEGAGLRRGLPAAGARDDCERSGQDRGAARDTRSR